MTPTPTVKRRLTWADVVPFPGNPIYEQRVEQMRKQWGGYDPSIVGSPAIADNAAHPFPELPEDALIVVDGNHRRALAEREGRLEDEFLADLHRGATRAELSRLRRGLNDRRTVKPAERFLELVAEGDAAKKIVKDRVEEVGWRITHEREPGGLSCTNELEWIYKRDPHALTYTLLSYMAIWGPRDYRSQARVVKGLGAFWIRYPDADLERLQVTMRRSGMSVDELFETGRQVNADTPRLKGVWDGIRYVLAAQYNRGHRKGILPLL